MPQWTEGTILANNLHLHYYRTGGKKPTLVLLHGFTDAGLCWTPIAQRLESAYDVVMLDARGHGYSDPPIGEHDFSIELLASDAWTVIESLQLDHPVLMGHSMGAHTAARIALAHPEQMSALVLEDPPWRAQSQDASQQEGTIKYLDEWANDMRTLQTKTRAEMIAQCVTEHPDWSLAEIEPWATAKQHLDTTVFTKGFYQMSRDWTHIVEPLTIPTLLITGDNQLGAIVSPEVAAQAIATMVNGELAHIAGAGHSIHRNQFEPFVHAVQKFLLDKEQ